MAKVAFQAALQPCADESVIDNRPPPRGPVCRAAIAISDLSKVRPIFRQG
ncbi:MULTISPECIES: hypothetical protein [unclassified Prochlorococcus]|nr:MULTISPECIES: hypothetical protein [unclassified Prochlorococcus]